MSFTELGKNNISENEKKISDYWQDIDILNSCIKNRDGKENFVFFEGPPTANGRPGIHHVIARTLKDSVNKYKTMQGYRVVRKAGWDTHGLPVEIEVEKKLGMTGKKDIEAYGIEEFCKKCRESVFSYEALWREMTKRMGYFIDLDNAYITLDNNYIETVWWILSEYFKKGLIYEGHKILPYCPRCGTGLASHEVAQGYQMDKVETVIVEMKRKDCDEYFLVWTTTPWTLASNVALCVNPQADYIKAKTENGKVYILAKALADNVLNERYEIIDEFKGSALEYVEYEQLMNFVTVPGKAFYVTLGDFVTMEDGTGIVHMAPAFGEDDYNIGQKYSLAVVNPVDESGKYMTTPWAGKFVIDADKDIIVWLKENRKLYKKQKIEHNYPHCWRCKTPLLYYARPSWYIRVTDYKDELIKANATVNWFPDFVGEKRFGNWLENLKDWAISRNRYWGTPLNIWRCECGHLETCSSRKELVEKAIEPIDENIELHRPYVDQIHFKCPVCGKPMNRVSDVIDCWFDSGAMPFAQYHFPFGDEDKFNDQFPADFICEGIDQTRGWFYSLILISTFLKGKAPYKNVLVNDLILDADGQKMSKSRGNTVDPFEMFDKYGADALRWYLLYVSPAWTPTKFDENVLREVISKFFSTLKNIYSFFAMYANIDGIEPAKFTLPVNERDDTDRWLISKFNTLVKEVTENMEIYDLTKSVRLIQDFVNEEFSNWYIRRNRRRFWENELTVSKKSVYLTTYEVLIGITKLAAPFAPYITEEIFRNLTNEQSVHLTDYPKYDISLVDKRLEEKMDLVRMLVSLGRSSREEAQIKVRQPINNVIIDGKYKETIGNLTDLIKEELNVKNITYVHDLNAYMNFYIKPDFKVCGKIFGSNVKALAAYLDKCDTAALMDELTEKKSADIVINNEHLSVDKEMLDIRITAKEGYNAQMLDNVFIIIDTELTPSLINEGYAREIVSKVQQMRKQMDFDLADRITTVISSDEAITTAAKEFAEFIKNETLSTVLSFESVEGEEVVLNGHKAKLSIKRV